MAREIFNKCLGVSKSDILICTDIDMLNGWQEKLEEDIIFLNVEIEARKTRGSEDDIYAISKTYQFSIHILSVIKSQIKKAQPKDEDKPMPGKKANMSKMILKLNETISKNKQNLSRVIREMNFWKNKLSDYTDIEQFYDEVNKL